MRLPPLNALRAFEAAARHCSFKKAGEELHVSAGAISRFVKLLEEDLGRQLFERLPNGLRLTDTGRRFYPSLARAFADIENAVTQAAASPEVIKIILPITIGTRLLIKKISEFNAAGRGPRVQYGVEFQGWNDFFEGGFDVGICCYVDHQDRPDGLEFRFLRPEVLTPLCAPRLLKSEPALRRPEDLAHFELLHTYLDKADWRHWLSAAEVETVDPESGQTFMAMEMAVRAAIDGYGVTIGDLTLFDQELQKGELVAPFELTVTEDTGYFLFGKPERLREPQIAAFCDWLLKEARESVDPALKRAFAAREKRLGKAAQAACKPLRNRMTLSAG